MATVAYDTAADTIAVLYAFNPTFKHTMLTWSPRCTKHSITAHWNWLMKKVCGKRMSCMMKSE